MTSSSEREMESERDKKKIYMPGEGERKNIYNAVIGRAEEQEEEDEQRFKNIKKIRATAIHASPLYRQRRRGQCWITVDFAWAFAQMAEQMSGGVFGWLVGDSLGCLVGCWFLRE